MNRIRELREARGWNQDFLGQKLNVRRAAVSKYENGKIPLTDATIILLSDIFGVSADYLLGRSAQPEAGGGESSLSPEIRELRGESCDLNDDEVKKVLEYVEFLKQKRRSALLSPPTE